MVDPIPLVPFIKGVPEASLGKQRVSDEPTRSFQPINGGIETTSGSEIFFKVPKGQILEVRHIHVNATNKSALGAQTSFFLTVIDAQDIDKYNLIWFPLILPRTEVINSGYGALSLLLNEGDGFKLTIATGVVTNSIFNASIQGFLIDKGEFSKKTNILI